MPIFILALVRLRVLTADRLRRNRRIGSSDGRLRASCCRRSTRSRSRSRWCRCSILFELSIWLASSWSDAGIRGVEERNSDRAGLTVLSADWVLPGRGPADPRTVRSPSRTGGSTPSARPTSSAAASTSRARRSCRASSTRTRTSSTRSTPGSGTGTRSGRGSRRTSSARRASTGAEMEAIARLGAAECLASGVTTVGDRELLRRRRPRVRRAGPARDRLPRGVRPRAPRRRSRGSRRSSSTCGRALGARPARRLATRALHLLHGGLRRVPRRSACRSRRTSTRAQDELDWLLRGEGPMRAGRRPARRAADGQTRHPPPRRRRACSRPRCRRALRQGRCRGDRIARRPRRRGRALPALERAPRLRHRAARRAACGRPAARGRHGRVLGALARQVRGAAGGRGLGPRPHRARRRALARRRRSSSPRSAGPRARPRRRGRLADAGEARRPRPSSRLAGSPYLPWEDPAAAVVYGGSPERVQATFVDGEGRYEKGGFEWHELTRRVRARERMCAPRTPRRTGELAAIEDTMFFPKLRRHAKWMFVFLALVFGVGFVVFGIGASRPAPASAT